MVRMDPSTLRSEPNARHYSSFPAGGLTMICFAAPDGGTAVSGCVPVGRNRFIAPIGASAPYSIGFSAIDLADWRNKAIAPYSGRFAGPTLGGLLITEKNKRSFVGTQKRPEQRFGPGTFRQFQFPQ
jgi:hypothetical protein